MDKHSFTKWYRNLIGDDDFEPDIRGSFDTIDEVIEDEEAGMLFTASWLRNPLTIDEKIAILEKEIPIRIIEWRSKFVVIGYDF